MSWTPTKREQEELSVLLENLKVKPPKLKESYKDRLKNHYERRGDVDKIYFDLAPKPYKELSEDFRNGTLDLKIEAFTVKRKEVKGYFPFKANNLDFFEKANCDFFDGEAVLHFPKGLKYIEVKLPAFKMYFKEIIPVMTGLANTIKYLNPVINQQFLFDYLIHVYDSFTFKDSAAKVDRQEVYKKIDEMILKAGKQRPKDNSKTNFLWNPDYELTEAEKKAEINKITGGKKSIKTCAELEKILKSWEKGKDISYSIIGNMIGKNKSSICRQLKKPENQHLNQIFEALKNPAYEMV